MSDWNGFGSLDLSGVEESKGGNMLPVGTHVVKCTEADMESFGQADSNKRLRCELASEDSKAKLNHSFNIVHTTSDMAQEIGRRMFKSFLVAGGHPNPDKPGDVSTIKGLRAKIVVGMGKPYKNKNGVEVQYPEVKSFDAAPGSSTKVDDKKFDDDIPF
tara:strand:- start:45914 stop:46390 length:477 start_codon:yes stop_codon:yes gene_type:complete